MVIMTLIFFISSLHLCIFFLFLRHSFFFSRLLRQLTSDPCRLTIRVCFFPWLTLLCRFLFLFFCHSSNTATRTHEIWEINHCHCSSTSERNIPHCVCLCVWLHTVSFLSVWFCLYCVFPISQDNKHKHSLSPFVWVLCVFSYFAGLSTAQVFSLQ